MVKKMSLLIVCLVSFIAAYGSMPRAARAPQPSVVVSDKAVPAPVLAVEKEETEVPEAAAAPKVDEIDIDIAAASRATVAELLNALLSDEYLLYVKAQNFHWNIKNSMNFNDLHLFFGKIYGELALIVDMVAERVRALGARTMGTMNEFIKNSRLKEEDGIVPSDKEMIKKLLDDTESIIRSLRVDIQKTAELNDMGTNNLLSDLITKHEKTAWMLRSYLQ